MTSASIFGNLLVLSLKPLEAGNGDEGDQGVQFVRRVFILITTPGEANSNSEGYTPVIQTRMSCQSSKNYFQSNLTPWDQTCLFSLVSIRTSGVPIAFSANLRISLMARGARFLNPTP